MAGVVVMLDMDVISFLPRQQAAGQAPAEALFFDSENGDRVDLSGLAQG